MKLFCRRPFYCRGVARLASSRGPKVQETSGRRRTNLNATTDSTLGLRFLLCCAASLKQAGSPCGDGRSSFGSQPTLAGRISRTTEVTVIVFRVARLASSRGPKVQETSDRRRTKFNVTTVWKLGLRFLVLRTQLEASWATPRNC